MTDKSRAEIAYDLMMGTLTPVTECPNPSLKHPGNTSDGFHTFDELYDHRALLTAALFNEWARRQHTPKRGEVPRVAKSWKHSDGEPCFGGGWFIVVADLPGVGQISYHYQEQYYEYFYSVPHVSWAPEYDGHSSEDVVSRLKQYLTPPTFVPFI